MDRIDILLGSIVPIPNGAFIKKLDFVIANISPTRAQDIVRQWESSDRHYDYAVCEGGEEILLFAKKADLEKFEFFTCLCPITAEYRMATSQEKKDLNP